MLSCQSLLIVGSAVSFEEAAQWQGMGGMGQPQDGAVMQLVHALAADTQSLADGGECLGWIVTQSVVGDDDLAQAEGEPLDEVEKREAHLGVVDDLVKIDGFGQTCRGLGRRDQAPMESDSAPDGTGDGWNSVGAEGGASSRVIALQSGPEAKTAFVQGIPEWQTPQPLLTHHPAHQPLVLGHLLTRDWNGSCSGNGGRHSDTSKVGFGLTPTKEVLLSVPATRQAAGSEPAAASMSGLSPIDSPGCYFSPHPLRMSPRRVHG